MAAADDILTRGIRHQLFLTRLASFEARKVREVLDQAIPDLLDHIELRLSRIRERGFDLGPVTTRRLRDMTVGITEMMDTSYAKARDTLRTDLRDLAGDETAFHAKILEDNVPIAIETTLPAPAALRSMVSSEPFEGKHLSRWFSDLKASQKRGLRDAIRQGITQGETVPQIVRRIRGTRAMRFRDGVLQSGRRGAEAIARTAVNHVSSRARMLTYQENSDIVKAMMWVSTLDGRTTPICQRLGGQVFPLEGGRRPPGPPAHVACRSTITPVLRSWKELGIPLREAPEGTRASLNGQVPARQNYNEFLRGRVAAGDMDTVREALGGTRAKLFAAGGLKVTSFTDRRGRLFNLKELRRREADVFDRLNIDAGQQASAA